MKTTICFLALLTIFVNRTPGQEPGFYPDKQTTIIQRSADFTVRLQRAGGEDLRLSIDKRGHQVSSFLLPREMAQVNKIEFVSTNRAVLLGYANGDVNEVIVVDLDSGKIADRFHCYAPALSPDKRFLAFVKFFPSHFVSGVSDEYMIYDLQKPPKMNRPPSVASDDVVNIGRAIYPRSATNQPDDNVGRPESEVHMMESAEFVWSPHGERLAFADRLQGRISLIVIVLSDSGTAVNLKEVEIKKSDVCVASEVDKCSFAVRSILFRDDEVKLKLRPGNSALSVKDEIDIRM